MSIRAPLIASFVLIAAMLALSAYGWTLLPDTVRIAVHFDANGVANGFRDKAHGLFILPVVALILTAVMAVIPRLEPRKFNLASSGKLYRVGWIGGVAVIAFAHAHIVLGALHVAVIGRHLILPVIGLLFAAIGNYLGKTRSNFFAGVRTPWTLSSDYSWEMSNRLTGRLFVLTGLVTIAVSFLVSMRTAGEIMLAAILASALTSVVASYFYWRRDPARHSGDGVPE